MIKTIRQAKRVVSELIPLALEIGVFIFVAENILVFVIQQTSSVISKNKDNTGEYARKIVCTKDSVTFT